MTLVDCFSPAHIWQERRIGIVVQHERLNENQESYKNGENENEKHKSYFSKQEMAHSTPASIIKSSLRSLYLNSTHRCPERVFWLLEKGDGLPYSGR